MSGEVKLDACPFPHEVKRGVFLEIDTEDFGFVRGACSDCGCAGPYVTLASEKASDAEKAEAALLWNRRPTVVTDDVVERVAEALANQIGMRNGAPPIRGCLHLMPAEMAAKFRDDARAIEAKVIAPLTQERERLRSALNFAKEYLAGELNTATVAQIQAIEHGSAALQTGGE
jgi:hypothetical protein